MALTQNNTDAKADDKDQTWIVAKDNNGKDVRVKAEDYPKWEQDQAAERTQ
jgi:hypothetical protein